MIIEYAGKRVIAEKGKYGIQFRVGDRLVSAQYGTVSIKYARKYAVSVDCEAGRVNGQVWANSPAQALEILNIAPEMGKVKKWSVANIK